jgi:hypothetical protein
MRQAIPIRYPPLVTRTRGQKKHKQRQQQCTWSLRSIHDVSSSSIDLPALSLTEGIIQLLFLLS